MLYKISGAWGNHEGSLVLWVWILALFGCRRGRCSAATCRPPFRARVLAVQALIGVGFLAFMLFTSNPFLRLDPAPIDGSGLNPVLQDPGLAFHPPMLYLGYVGLSTAYSFAVAALIEGRVDATWARWVRPWTLAAWVGADARHRARQLVGLLRARLGRLVVLGPGRERLVHALARRHRPAALGDRGREARRAEELDHPARDPRLLALAARAPSWSARACSPRCTPSPPTRRAACSSWRCSWSPIGGSLAALRLARAGAAGRRPVRADLARGRPAAQQPAARRPPPRPCCSAPSTRWSSTRWAAPRSRSARRSSTPPSCR